MHVPGTITELIARRAADMPDRVFLETAGRRITYRELADEVAEWGSRLAGLGMRPGDRVCLLLGNRAETVLAWLAVAASGAIEVPLNINQRGELLGRMIDDAGPRIMLVEAEHAACLSSPLPDSVEAVVSLCGGELPEGWPVRSLPAPAAGPVTLPKPSDPAAILYTSGTTGGTKGAVCTQRFLLTFAQTLVEQFQIGPGDVLYNCLPQFHSSGQIAGTLSALLSGARLVVDERFSRTAFWPRVAECGATVALAMGGMLSLLETLPPSPLERAHRLRVIYGTPAPSEQVARLEARYGTLIRQNYGSTEQGIVAAQELDMAVPGSVGRPLPHIELVIAGEDDEPLPPGEAGAILVRPRRPWTIFSGYWNKPELSNQALRNLWFHSGDMGYLDADGNLWFVDRAGDVIRRRGENIAAAELESAVAAHPGVLEAAAIGVPSPMGEQDVLLAVVPAPGATLDPAELVAFCEEHVAKFMVPRYVDLVDELPKTSSEKVQRALLRERGVRPGVFDREAGLHQAADRA